MQTTKSQDKKKSDDKIAVYISYNHKDAAWKHRLLFYLLRQSVKRVPFEVWDDSNLEPGENWTVKIPEVRNQARVAVLLISKNYLDSATIRSEELPHLLNRQTENNLRLVPVLIEPCEWQSVEWLSQLQILPRGVTPLSTLSNTEAEESLKKIVDEIVAVIENLAPPPISPPPSESEPEETTIFRRLSASALRALNHADGIRIARQQDRIQMEDLLAGLFEKIGGPMRQLLLNDSIDENKFYEIIETATNTTLPRREAYEPSGLSALSFESQVAEPVREALIAARNVADANGSTALKSQHLVYGVLSVEDNDIIKALSERGVRKENLDWTEASEASPTIAGYQSDGSDGKDLLDIKKDVEALCSVIAAKEVAPPLSIGLFGDWGSGKSFFMKKMEERLEELKRAAKQAQNETAYCAHLVQIKFNAWHYIDANLWASLNTEIFERLAWALTENTGPNAEYERVRLQAETTSKKNELAEAEKEKAEAETKLRDNELRLNQIDARSEAAAEKKLSLRVVLQEVFRVATHQPEVRQKIDEINQQVDDAMKALQLDETKAAAGKVKAQLLELHGIGGRLRAIWFSLCNPRDRKIWLVSLAALVLIPITINFLLPELQAFLHSPLLETLKNLIGGFRSLLLAIAAGLGPFIRRAQSALKIIDEARESNRKLIEDAKLAEKNKLLQERTAIEGQVKDADERIKKANDSIEEYQKQLDQLRADQQMANFIKQRKASDDYTKYLGVIARVRGDFEQLSTLLANVRKDAENEEERQRREKESNIGTQAGEDKKEQAEEQKPLLPRIDRIILYIDDLDRCPEDKVVEVLQAVHLLLAFPLFVVVVAVDSRWLLHSLKQQSKAFQGLTSEGGEMSDEERTHWQATPLNYLEKIFQIPFTLRPMEQAGFGKLIEDLVKQPEKARDTKVETETKPVEEKKEPTAVNGPQKEQDAVKPVSDEPRIKEDKALQPPSNIGKPDSTVQTPQPNKLKTEQATPPLAEKLAATKPDAVSQIQSAIDTNPQHLEITAWEREFMVKLFPLIPSPRAAKRFVNIYRLIKASVEADNLQAFIGDATQGQYRPVLLLLAILTGYPSEATDILRDLVEQEHEETWWKFIKDSIAQRILTGGSGNVAGSVRESETLRWLQLQHHLESLESLIPNNHSCIDFVAWARVVARYSFQSGRILLTSNVADSKKNQTLQLQHAA